ncbi:MAG: hypothetical protein K5696_07010 [Lachnospiraceae bacterium]|nr:hypothetical protein [Lachnospiraceae bacterium]
MENKVKMVPAKCTQCGGVVEVNKTEQTATCPYCGTQFVIEKAISDYNVKFDVNGAVKDVLAFAGEQMKENRKERREQKKEFAKTEKKFFKIFGIAFALFVVVDLIIFVIFQFTQGPESETEQSTENQEYAMGCSVEDGCLYTQVTGSELVEWKYLEFESQGTKLVYEQNDFDTYSSCVAAVKKAEGVRYVVTAAYEGSVSESATPIYYSVVNVTIEGGRIIEATEPVFVDDLSDYDFE